MIQKQDELPALPKHKIEILKRNPSGAGFLKTLSADIRLSYHGDESMTAPREMTVDHIDRKSLDAVAVLAWAEIDGEYYVYLRSCIRPALALRHWDSRDNSDDFNQWEIPAGLIDPPEKGDSGVLFAASRELKEEVGVYVNPQAFKELGPYIFSSVGMSGERIYFVHTSANPKHVEKATLDGSALEEGGRVVLVNIEAALDAINDGKIRDSKTIIALERFAKVKGFEL